jgi:hypothetical protein
VPSNSTLTVTFLASGLSCLRMISRVSVIADGFLQRRSWGEQASKRLGWNVQSAHTHSTRLRFQQLRYCDVWVERASLIYSSTAPRAVSATTSHLHQLLW